MKPTIYLDMDGVSCDFIKDAVTAFGREDLIKSWPKECYDVEEALKVSPKEFWETIYKQGEQFWIGLEEFPWFWELYNGLSQLGDVYFCTSPNRDPNCVKGKLTWIQSRFGPEFRKFIFIKDKFLLAKKDNFLVDDWTEQCLNFSNNGGNAILFPQPWNSNFAIKNRVSFVLSSIENRLK